jgi:IPT/TIG domain-containing protein/flagellar hook capping protein FlgD/alginate lyase
MNPTRRASPPRALQRLAAFLGAVLLVGSGWQDAQSAVAAPDASGAPKPSRRALVSAATSTPGIWISRQEILALPMSGPAWNALKAQADRPAGTPDVGNQDETANVYVLAKALVHVRTGIESYRTEVRQGCMAAINTELGGRTLALGRKLAAYVIAADLVGLEASEDSTFRAWLRRCLTETLDGRTLQSTHEGRPNNWGTMAGGSRAAVAVYLGDSAEMARTAQVFKGWLGDRSSYAGFVYGDLSWQCDSLRPVGINPRGCMKQGESIDGALPDDMRRGCSFKFPPCNTGYPIGALQGVTLQAEILHRQGYDAWNWEDQAIRRAFQFLLDLEHRYGGWWAVGNDECFPWLANHAYGTSFPAVSPAGPGKNMAWMDWTHGSYPPTSISFQPTSGLAGAEVVIDGTSLATTNAVAFNGIPATFTVLSHTRLRATVPPGAGAGPIRVTNQFGSATSVNVFTVLAPPTVALFTPSSGPVGAEVTVHGANFSNVTGVTFGGAPAAFYTIDSDTRLRVTVPGGASSGPIGVTNPAGTAISAGTFIVIVPPTISSFLPLSGPVGTEVTVHGTSFGTASAVTFGGTPVDSFAVEGDTLLRAKVPAGASSGAIGVANPAGTAISAGTFTIIAPPTISFFSPTSGPVGTELTVHGTGLGTAYAVSLGGTAVDSFGVEGDTLLRAKVPAGATSGAIGVVNLAGTATSAGTFTVIVPPTIGSFDPSTGPVGTQVTVHGTGFMTASVVRFNGTAAVFTIDTDALLRATVPMGATSGPVSVTNPAATGTTAASFTVIPAPTITFFIPTSGPEGTEVTLHGIGFTTASAVRFNGAPWTYAIDSDTTLRATVPPAATSGPISVTNPAGTATTADTFTVIAAPTITTFHPGSGPVGIEVTVHGTGFAAASLVTFGGSPADSFAVASDTMLRVTAPAGATTGHISITSPAGIAISADKFTVVAPPTIISFSPTGGPVGSEVELHGIGFSTATTVTFNGTPADSFAAESDTLLHTVVPVGASSGPISVTNPAGTYVSEEGFTVTDLVAVGGDAIACELALGRSHPNPFGARTSVRFDLPRPGRVRLTIYDVMGRAVRTLVDGELAAGVHEMPWDALDETGRQVGSGVYLLRFETPGFTATRRLLRMR